MAKYVDRLSWRVQASFTASDFRDTKMKIYEALSPESDFSVLLFSFSIFLLSVMDWWANKKW